MDSLSRYNVPPDALRRSAESALGGRPLVALPSSGTPFGDGAATDCRPGNGPGRSIQAPGRRRLGNRLLVLARFVVAVWLAGMMLRLSASAKVGRRSPSHGPRRPVQARDGGPGRPENDRLAAGLRRQGRNSSMVRPA